MAGVRSVCCRKLKKKEKKEKNERKGGRHKACGQVSEYFTSLSSRQRPTPLIAAAARMLQFVFGLASKSLPSLD